MNFHLWSRTAMLAAVLCAPLPAAAKDKAGSHQVNLNTASAEELSRVEGIGPGRAALLVRIRERNGPFRSVEEIRILPRFTQKMMDRARPQLTIGPADDILNSSEDEPRHSAGPPR